VCVTAGFCTGSGRGGPAGNYSTVLFCLGFWASGFGHIAVSGWAGLMCGRYLRVGFAGWATGGNAVDG
jgi:hypothetical protein